MNPSEQPIKEKAGFLPNDRQLQVNHQSALKQFDAQCNKSCQEELLRQTNELERICQTAEKVAGVSFGQAIVINHPNQLVVIDSCRDRIKLRLKEFEEEHTQLSKWINSIHFKCSSNIRKCIDCSEIILLFFFQMVSVSRSKFFTCNFRLEHASFGCQDKPNASFF